MTALALVGLPGAGKSTAGAAAAARSGLKFVDLDRCIEELAGERIPEIFARHGEKGFRALETEATRAVLQEGPAIVAPGGGWIAQEPNRALALLYDCRPVWLAVSPPQAVKRMGSSVSDRPLLGSDPEGALQDILTRRTPYYAGSQARIDTEVLSLQEVVDEVARLALVWHVRIG